MAISKHKFTLKSHKLTKEVILWFRYVVKLRIYMQFVDMYERTLICMNNNWLLSILTFARSMRDYVGAVLCWIHGKREWSW